MKSTSSKSKTLTLKVVKADIKATGIVPVALLFQHK
jgi:hypothetical protein